MNIFFRRLLTNIINKPVSFEKDSGDKSDLLIIDDFFPGFKSNWRNSEFSAYAATFSNVTILCSGEHLNKKYLNQTSSFEEELEKTLKKYPAFSKHSIKLLKKKNKINPKLAYCIFLFNMRKYYKVLEKLNIPFAFTLYPGGGMRLYNKNVDDDLKQIFSSPLFRKVIVTQPFVLEYLIENQMVNTKKIEYIYGVPVPQNREVKRIYYGEGRQEMNICFVAAKNQPKGIDKGYDIFVKTADKLIRKYDKMRFHVVGGFSEMDQTGLTSMNEITYHNFLDLDQLHNFFTKMDCIVSPNRAFVLFPGAFDGFPTASVVEASINGALAICTDPLDVAKDVGLINRQHLYLTSTRPSEIENILKELYFNPKLLKNIARSGQNRFKELYSDEVQLSKRIDLISNLVTEAELVSMK